MTAILLRKQPVRIEYPWEMGVIEDALPKSLADYMADNFLSDEFVWQEEYNAYQSMGAANLHDSVFKNFFEDVWLNRYLIRDRICSFLKIDSSDCDFNQMSYNSHCADPKCTVARDWHVDLPSKKVQMLLYLGKSSDTVTFQMTDNPEEGAKRSFTMQHNRLVFWNSNDTTYHKFYFTPYQRNTIVMTFNYKSSKAGYRGIPEQYL